MSEFSFNANEVEDFNDFEPLPAGDYQAVLIASDVKENARQTGMLFVGRFEILGPTHTGRQVFLNANIRNDNKTAEKIGLSLVKSLCLACGKPSVEDTCELHDTPVNIRLTIDKKDPTRNNIVSCHPLESQIKKPTVAAIDKIPNQKPVAANSPWTKKT